MMKIIPIEYGKSVLKESMIFYDGAEDKLCPIIFMVFLIKTENRLILVDAGCETMPGFVMQDFIGVLQALKKLDINPGDVTDVIITHAHHDHIECVKYFTNAVIYIEKDEYESGKAYIPDGFITNIFTDRFIICKGVEVLKVGGHSKGSCIVVAEIDDKIFVIAGDECYSRLCLKRKKHTGSFYNEKASIEFVYKYSDEKYTVLLCHDV